MTAAEETLMMAYYRIDPWGDHRADIRSAQIVKMLYDVNRGKKGKERKLTDFLMFWKKPTKVDPNVATSIRDHFGKLVSKE